MDPEVRTALLRFQHNEITEHHIYRAIAAQVGRSDNREILEKIADDELRHYRVWAQHTGEDVSANRAMVFLFTMISRVLGFTFAVKLMERGEAGAHTAYTRLPKTVEEAQAIAREEDEHEDALLAMLDEERLQYTGSMVLGLNDALVELTGALAGLTLALQNTRLVALTGSITGIAAALSMAASEYLSTKEESAETSRNPFKAAAYTGIAYILTVVLLILPYLLVPNPFVCLALTMSAAILVIAFFNYYVSVAKDLPFRKRFLEMSGISLGVAAFSFLVGLVMHALLPVDV